MDSRKLKPDLIEGWDPLSGIPQPNGYLRYRIHESVISAAAVISDVVVDGNSRSVGRT